MPPRAATWFHEVTAAIKQGCSSIKKPDGPELYRPEPMQGVDEAAKARAEAAQPATSAVSPVSTTSRYLLQAGSYPTPKAADEVKAKLDERGLTLRC